MVWQRDGRWLALMFAVVLAGVAFGSATAVAAELSDYRWERRPLLVFAPTDSDPRLLETLNRIESSRCEFISRDMVLGVVVAEGTSTLDGQAVDASASHQLRDRYTIGENAFRVLLIGKDGGEKRRVDDVPDLGAIYTLIDGMPMRNREMAADPGRC